VSTKVSRILHAGYLLECEGARIAMDPIFENPFSRNCYAFPPVKFDTEQIKALRLDAVFISHYHDDHCSMESLSLLDKSTPIYMFCVHGEMFELIRHLGFEQVHSLELDKPVPIQNFTVTPRRALDEDVDTIFQIQTPDVNILNVVDSWIPPETLALLAREDWDLILWPFQTMREIEVIAPDRASTASPELPEEWTEPLQQLKPKYLVPSSCQFQLEEWSWYNRAFFPITYKKFAEYIKQILPATQTIRLNPGVSISFDDGTLTPAEPLTWIAPLGDQNVDYEFNPDIKPPPTSEIAKRFLPLTPEQHEHVLRFCRFEIMERFESFSADPYFNSPRAWRLTLYDHQGEALSFDYRLENGRLSPGDSTTQPEWLTEVSTAKLYAALELGESLTSMYVRILGAKFEDIVDDPLLASLFNGVFAAYQISQLQTIHAHSGCNH